MDTEHGHSTPSALQLRRRQLPFTMTPRPATLRVLATLLALAPGAVAFQNGAPAPTQKADPAAAAAPVVVARPPTPLRWPLVGTLPDFLARGGADGLAEVHGGMYRDYGPVYGLDLVGSAEVVFADPRVMDQVRARRRRSRPRRRPWWPRSWPRRSLR